MAREEGENGKGVIPEIMTDIACYAITGATLLPSRRQRGSPRSAQTERRAGPVPHPPSTTAIAQSVQ